MIIDYIIILFSFFLFFFFGFFFRPPRAPVNPSVHQCLFCKRYHSLRFCRKFLDMDIGSRRREARRLGYCFNCLARSHRTYECHSEDACKHCGNDHHTLLHLHPLEKITLQQMERGRIEADLRHLLGRRDSLSRINGDSGHQRKYRRRSEERRATREMQDSIHTYHDREKRNTRQSHNIRDRRQYEGTTQNRDIRQHQEMLQLAISTLERLKESLEL